MTRTLSVANVLTGMLLVSLCAAAAAADDPTRASVGAIRWDAWGNGEVTRIMEQALGPSQFQARLPWFADVQGDGKVHINGNRQEVMDQEITLAANAGLDYWAFVLYPEQDSMSTALKLYLKSAKRQQIGFCLILHNALGVDEEQWPKERARALALLREPGYKTVLNGRPLVYSFQADVGRVADYRQAAQAAGMKPYCVFMGWDPVGDFRNVEKQGFDAVSAYASPSADASYAQLCQRTEDSFWKKAAAAKVPYVPVLTTGWDKRPRQVHTVPWEEGQSHLSQKIFPSTATPAEIVAHLKHALEFVRGHKDVCRANTIIVYAWNEHDEGGWLCPTWRATGIPDNSRLEAISELLRKGL